MPSSTDTFPHPNLNVRDISQRQEPPEPVVTGAHRPLFLIMSDKGPVGVPVTGGSRYLRQAFGDDLFNTSSPFYNHSNLFLQRALTYQAAHVVRVAPDTVSNAGVMIAARFRVLQNAPVLDTRNVPNRVQGDDRFGFPLRDNYVEVQWRVLDIDSDKTLDGYSDEYYLDNVTQIPVKETYERDVAGVTVNTLPVTPNINLNSLNNQTGFSDWIPILGIRYNTPGTFGNKHAFTLSPDLTGNSETLRASLGGMVFTFVPKLLNELTNRYEDYNDRDQVARQTVALEDSAIDNRTTLDYAIAEVLDSGYVVDINGRVVSTLDATVKPFPKNIRLLRDIVKTSGFKSNSQITKFQLVNSSGQLLYFDADSETGRRLYSRQDINGGAPLYVDVVSDGGTDTRVGYRQGDDLYHKKDTQGNNLYYKVDASTGRNVYFDQQASISSLLGSDGSILTPTAIAAAVENVNLYQDVDQFGRDVANEVTEDATVTRTVRIEGAPDRTVEYNLDRNEIVGMVTGLTEANKYAQPLNYVDNTGKKASVLDAVWTAEGLSTVPVIPAEYASTYQILETTSGATNEDPPSSNYDGSGVWADTADNTTLAEVNYLDTNNYTRTRRVTDPSDGSYIDYEQTIRTASTSDNRLAATIDIERHTNASGALFYIKYTQVLTVPDASRYRIVRESRGRNVATEMASIVSYRDTFIIQLPRAETTNVFAGTVGAGGVVTDFRRQDPVPENSATGFDARGYSLDKLFTTSSTRSVNGIVTNLDRYETTQRTYQSYNSTTRVLSTETAESVYTTNNTKRIIPIGESEPQLVTLSRAIFDDESVTPTGGNTYRSVVVDEISDLFKEEMDGIDLDSLDIFTGINTNKPSDKLQFLKITYYNDDENEYQYNSIFDSSKNIALRNGRNDTTITQMEENNKENYYRDFEVLSKDFFDNNINILSSARYPVTHAYDSGYHIEVKRSMINFLSRKRDVKVEISTQSAHDFAVPTLTQGEIGSYIGLNDYNTRAEDLAIGMSLRVLALTNPDSLIFNTQVYRCSIYQQAGRINYARRWRAPIPMTLARLDKRSRYDAGTTIPTLPVGLPNSAIDIVEEINWAPQTDLSRRDSWSSGLNYVDYYDEDSLHFQDYRTVYTSENSILSGDLEADTVVYIMHILRRIWANNVGSRDNPRERLYNRIRTEIVSAVANLTQSRIEADAYVYQTNTDRARGFADTLRLELRFPFPHRVLNIIVDVNRLEEDTSLPEAA